MQIRAPITVNILIDTVDSTVSGIFMPKRRMTMLNIELQHFGGRGAASSTAKGKSSLKYFKEAARQFNEVKISANKGNYYALEYTHANGETITYYTYYSQGNGNFWKKHTLGARARSKQAMSNSKVI